MLISVRYFGVVRERITQRREEQLKLGDGQTVQHVIDEVCTRYPSLNGMRDYVKVAVNDAYAVPGTALCEGDCVALIPPVAGGADVPYCRLSSEPLELDEVIRAVTGSGQGGIVTFLGVVRDHNDGHSVMRLEYEAYPSMVLKTLTDIVTRCEAIAPNVRVAVSHRVGCLDLGEAAVAIAASAPHRAEAFDACRLCIELLKAEVPIWKKEWTPDGGEWLGLRP